MDILEYVEQRRRELEKKKLESNKPIIEVLKERRNERISMRVTKSEKEFINKIASESDVTITELFLNLIMDHYK